MTFCLFGTKPLSEPTMYCFQLVRSKQISTTKLVMKVSDKLYCLMLTCIYCAVYVHTICSCNCVLSGLVPYCESGHWFSESDQYVASPILPIWCCHKAPVALLSIEITTWNMSVNLYFITSRWRPWGVWVHTNYSHRLTNIKYGNQWNNSTDFLSTDSQQGSG